MKNQQSKRIAWKKIKHANTIQKKTGLTTLITK